MPCFNVLATPSGAWDVPPETSSPELDLGFRGYSTTPPMIIPMRACEYKGIPRAINGKALDAKH